MQNQHNESALVEKSQNAVSFIKDIKEAIALGAELDNDAGSSETLLSAYDEAYNEDRSKHVPHYALSTNPLTSNLKLDLSAVPLVFTLQLPEFVFAIAKPILEDRFEGLQIFDAGIVCTPENGLHGETINTLTAGITCYQLDEEGKIIEGAHDIEIMVDWHSSMTTTSNFKLIEKLIYDLPDPDFSLEALNESIAKIGLGASQ